MRENAAEGERDGKEKIMHRSFIFSPFQTLEAMVVVVGGGSW